MKYKLKKNAIEAFTVVDGPFAGRSYVQGKVYDEVPPQEKHKFVEIRRAERKAQSGKRKAQSAESRAKSA